MRRHYLSYPITQTGCLKSTKISKIQKRESPVAWVSITSYFQNPFKINFLFVQMIAPFLNKFKIISADFWWYVLKGYINKSSLLTANQFIFLSSLQLVNLIAVFSKCLKKTCSLNNVCLIFFIFLFFYTVSRSNN